MGIAYRCTGPPALLVDPACGWFHPHNSAKVGRGPQTSTDISAQSQNGALLGYQAGLSA